MVTGVAGFAQCNRIFSRYFLDILKHQRAVGPSGSGPENDRVPIRPTKAPFGICVELMNIYFGDVCENGDLELGGVAWVQNDQ